MGTKDKSTQPKKRPPERERETNLLSRERKRTPKERLNLKHRFFQLRLASITWNCFNQFKPKQFFLFLQAQNSTLAKKLPKRHQCAPQIANEIGKVTKGGWRRNFWKPWTKGGSTNRLQRTFGQHKKNDLREEHTQAQLPRRTLHAAAKRTALCNSRFPVSVTAYTVNFPWRCIISTLITTNYNIPIICNDIPVPSNTLVTSFHEGKIWDHRFFAWKITLCLRFPTLLPYSRLVLEVLHRTLRWQMETVPLSRKNDNVTSKSCNLPT